MERAVLAPWRKALRGGLTGEVEEGRADLIWIGRQDAIELLNRCSILCVQKYRHKTERIGGCRLVRLRNAGRTVTNNEIGDDNIWIRRKDDALLVRPSVFVGGCERNMRQSGRRSTLIPKVR